MDRLAAIPALPYLPGRDPPARHLGLARGRLVASLHLLVPHSLREKIKLVLTDLQSPRARETLARLSSSGEAIYLNLGCGDQPIEGWGNIDLLGMGADVA